MQGVVNIGGVVGLVDRIAKSVQKRPIDVSRTCTYSTSDN